MQFHYGAVPEDAHFVPEIEGWLAIREPGSGMMQLIALLVALALLLLSGRLLYLVFPRELLLIQPPTISMPIWLLLLILVLLIPVHELLHVICHPAWGFSPASVIGFWLSKVLFYAHYEGAMSRNRFLLVFAGPYIVLSLLPIVVIALLRVFGWTPVMMSALAFLSLVGELWPAVTWLAFG